MSVIDYYRISFNDAPDKGMWLCYRSSKITLNFFRYLKEINFNFNNLITFFKGRYNDKQIMEYAIENGLDINYRDEKTGNTLFHGKVATKIDIDYLIKNHFDFSALNNN